MLFTLAFPYIRINYESYKKKFLAFIEKAYALWKNYMQLFSNLSLPDIELPFLYQPFMDICTYNVTYITIRGIELS